MWFREHMRDKGRLPRSQAQLLCLLAVTLS